MKPVVYSWDELYLSEALEQMSGDHDVKLYEQNGVWTLLNEQTIGASSLDACFLQCYCVRDCDLLALAVGAQSGEEQNCLVMGCRMVQ